MRTLTTLVVSILIATAPLCVAATIVSPGTGETWTVGEMHTLSWKHECGTVWDVWWTLDGDFSQQLLDDYVTPPPEDAAVVGITTLVPHPPGEAGPSPWDTVFRVEAKDCSEPDGFSPAVTLVE